MTKLVSGLLGLLIIFACVKEEIAEEMNQVTETRSGNVLPMMFLGSLTIWDANTKTQVIFNKDSIGKIEVAKVRNKQTAVMGVPHTGAMFKTAQYRVVMHWKNGKNDFSGTYAMKDTSASYYQLTSLKGQSIVGRFISIKQTDAFLPYYDYRFNRNKKSYLYEIKTDTSLGEQSIQAWHHQASSVFFMDHKI